MAKARHVNSNVEALIARLLRTTLLTFGSIGIRAGVSDGVVYRVNRDMKIRQYMKETKCWLVDGKRIDPQTGEV